MKTLYPSKGYTIIEVMIFLVVSAGLFGSVIGAMIQQTRRNEFVQSIDNFQVQLQDALNNVSTGYYPSSGNIRCSHTASGPDVTTATEEQGTNIDCVFIGNAVQLSSGGMAGTYSIYSMVGNRQVGTPKKNVELLSDAKPQLLGAGNNPGIAQTESLLPGVNITKVVNLDSGAPIGGFVLVSDFAKKDPVTQRVSGNSARVSLRAVQGSILTDPNTVFDNRVRLTGNLVDAPKGILICIEEDSGRKASITVGGNNQQLSIDKTVDGWPTGINGCA